MTSAPVPAWSGFWNENIRWIRHDDLGLPSPHSMPLTFLLGNAELPNSFNGFFFRYIRSSPIGRSSVHGATPVLTDSAIS